jgi:hypothetical protein
VPITPAFQYLKNSEAGSQNALYEAPAVKGIGIHREAPLEILASEFWLLASFI